jgi:hypothetical protein
MILMLSDTALLLCIMCHLCSLLANSRQVLSEAGGGGVDEEEGAAAVLGGGGTLNEWRKVITYYVSWAPDEESSW